MPRVLDMHEADEARWADAMARAQAGDRAVYEALLGELGDVIETYLKVRFGDLSVLEDCVQESLIAVHRARHTWDPARPFRPWLFTIVRHRAIDVLRRGPSELTLDERIPERGEDITTRLLDVIDGLKLLATLSPDHREALVLTKYGGYTTREAATVAGVSEPALKARLHRALKHLERALEHEEGAR